MIVESRNQLSNFHFCLPKPIIHILSAADYNTIDRNDLHYPSKLNTSPFIIDWILIPAIVTWEPNPETGMD